MRTADEIAASLLERRRTTSARGWFDDLQKDITAAITAARRDGAEQMREAAGKVCDVESAEYKSNAMKCDAGGNTFGGTMDSCGALACERVRDNIIALPLPGDEPKEPDHAK